MSRRIIGEHFRPDGKAKRGFDEKVEALEEANTHGKQVYKCNFCGLYHIGGKGTKVKSTRN